MTIIPIQETVKTAIEKYFQDLNGSEPADLYILFLYAAEKPFLETVFNAAGRNKTIMARWLGINRGTLRTKLNRYGID